MKPIEQINWTWMKRNLHEVGFEKLIEAINLTIERVNLMSEKLELKDETDDHP